MKKIAFIIRCMDGGGVERTLLNLLDAIDKSQFMVTLFLFEKKGILSKKISNEIQVVDLSLTSYYFSRVCFKSKEKFSQLLQNKEYFKAIKLAFFEKRSTYISKKYGNEAMYRYYIKVLPGYDEVFNLAVDFYGYGDFTGAYVLTKLKAKRKVSWLHDESQNWTNAMRDFYPSFDYIYGCSIKCRNNFIARFPDLKEKCGVFYNIVPSSEIMKQAKKYVHLEGKVVLVTAGRLVEQKGYDLAIKAAKMLKDDGIEFKWYFVGAGEQEESLRKLAENCGVDDLIIFCGFQTNPYSFMEACDIYVQPSRHEGYCTTITEAKVLKKVILATDVSGVREQLRDGETGVIIRKIDEISIYEALKNIITDNTMRTHIKMKIGQERVDYSAELKKLYDLCD